MDLHRDAPRVVQVVVVDDHHQVDQNDDDAVVVDVDVEDHVRHESAVVVHPVLLHRRDRDHRSSQTVAADSHHIHHHHHLVVEAAEAPLACEVEDRIRHDAVHPDADRHHSHGIVPDPVEDSPIDPGSGVGHDRDDDAVVVDSGNGTGTDGEEMENTNDCVHDDDAHVPPYHRGIHEAAIDRDLRCDCGDCYYYYY